MNQIAYPPIVILSADQLRELIDNAVEKATSPLTAQLESVERRLAEPRLRYSSHEIAALYGVSIRTVREWIRQGRVDKNGKRRFLSASELTHGKYSISQQSVHTFLSYFE
jgi:hypothetical protein